MIHELTEEQEKAVELATTGESLKINAYAGAGKTSTLVEMALNKPKRSGVYLAFNRSIADEAKEKFPPTVECSTIHSKAFRAVGRFYSDRLKGRLTPKIVMEALRVEDCGKFSAYRMAGFAIQTVTKFCQTGCGSIGVGNTPPLPTLNSETEKEVRLQVAGYAHKLWEKIIDRDSRLPVTHDNYLKLWALSNPVLSGDFIMLDEGQDSNGVVLDLFLKQRAQQIVVGDNFQQIYSWRGAVNAMEIVKTVHECELSQSFRFGSAIADAANRILNGYIDLDEPVNIKGFDRIDSIVAFGGVSSHDVELFRTNAALLGRLINLVEEKPSLDVAVVKGVNDLINLLNGLTNLKNNIPSDEPELISFSTWEDVTEYVGEGFGGDLAPIVKIIAEGRGNRLKGVLQRIKYNKESEADVVLSTAHKAKGREWDSVRLHNDFPVPYTDIISGELIEPDESDVKLLYVAATRAKKVLDVSACDAVKLFY